MNRILCAALVWWMTTAMAAALDLTPGEPVRRLLPHIRFLQDDGRALSEVIAAYRQGRFETGTAVLKTFEYPWDPFWMAVPLTNRSSDDGRPPDVWRLATGPPVLLNFQAYLIRASRLTEVLLDAPLHIPFSAEVHTLAGLVSEPLSLAPGEEALLLIYYQTFFDRSIWIGLETEESLNERRLSNAVGYALFYSAVICGILLFSGFCLSMGNRSGLLLAVLAMIGLLQHAENDRLLFRFLWPENPMINFRAADVLMLVMSFSGFLVAGRLLRIGEKWRLVSRAVTALSILPLILLPIAGTGDASLPSQILYTIMLAVLLVAAALWRTINGRVYLLSDLMAVAAAVTMVAFVIAIHTGAGLQVLPMNIVGKTIYSLVIFSVALGLTSHLITLRRDHDEARERERVALANEAERSRALLEAERNYTRARDLARLRRSRLATASHDLKQPLTSLRMTMDAIADDSNSEVQRRLREAFDYMEELASGYLAETRPEDVDGDADDGSAHDEQSPRADGGKPEPYEISLVLRAVRQMFADEARAKGLHLRIVDCHAQITVPPLVLMRIVANLVSNAVKYTEKGKVLIGCRRRRTMLVVEVHDTGAGMAPKTLDDFLRPYRKGEGSEGEGLGLSICDELAAAQGLEFEAVSQPGKGTCFRVGIAGP